MVADRLTQAVRHQLGLGRLLPLGEPQDGLWMTEQAAVRVLTTAAAALPGLRLDALRIALAAPETALPPAVPPPPGALWPGPLRIEADFAATGDEPLPAAAARLRSTLAGAVDRRLGLSVTAIDLHVSALLDERNPGAARDSRRFGAAAAGAGPGGTAGVDPGPGGHRRPYPAPEAGGARPAPAGHHPYPEGAEPAAAAGAAAEAVPGVARLAPVLGGRGALPLITDGPDGRHVLVQIATADGHRALDAARAARDAVQDAVQDTAQDAVQDTAQDTAQDAVQDTAQDAVQDTAQDTAQDAVQDAAQGAAQEALRGADGDGGGPVTVAVLVTAVGGLTP